MTPLTEDALWAQLEALHDERPEDFEADPDLAELAALAADRRRHSTSRPPAKESR